MRFEPREYQANCVSSWLDAFESPECSPLVAVPTGAGKTVIMCEFIVQWLESHPDHNVLVLSHTQEILRQNHAALLEYFPAFGVGIYSAGLESKRVRKITVGGIQSVYKYPEKFKNTDICIVDEAHAINHEDRGMYRKFFNKVSCLVGGMSATVFRMGHGYIHKGDDTLFNHLAYDLTSIKHFNKLVEDGYLTKLLSKATDFELDSSKVKKAAGDYNLKDLSKTHDRHAITKAAIQETLAIGERYKKWLVFAIDIAHADNICAELRANGIDADVMHTRMEQDRIAVVDRFKYQGTRALVSVGMVTTGFDAPNVDLLVVLRPTLSTVLHVQMVGRGLRTAPGKSHCLVLDFAGNTALLGPINDPIIPQRSVRKGSGVTAEGFKPTKNCPKCKCINHARAYKCDNCKYIFPVKSPRLKVNPDGTPVVAEKAGEGKDWLPVLHVHYAIHNKSGKPPSLKVTYICGVRTISEWVCLNHTGFAKAKADKWLSRREPTCNIFTTEMAYHRRHKIAKPLRIKVQEGRYTNVVDYDFGKEL